MNINGIPAQQKVHNMTSDHSSKNSVIIGVGSGRH